MAARDFASGDAVIRRRLEIVMVLYEAAVISVILAAGAAIALSQGGTLAAAAPLIVIGLAESLRIPLAGWSTRLNLPGKALAFLALAAIALASFDGLALVFSIFIDNRISNILVAQHRVEALEHAAAAVAGDVLGFTAEVAELDAELAALAKSMPQPPAGTNRVCTWRGARVTCAADLTSAATYQAAMRSYDARLADLTAKRSGLTAKVDAARSQKGAPEALAKARQALDDELMASPMHKLAATLFGVRVADLTEDQFNVLKRFAVVGLAGCFATLSMLVSIVVHLTPRDLKPGKLALALRRMFAARRKTLRRILERVEYRDRVKFVYVPCDPATGKVLDPDIQGPRP